MRIPRYAAVLSLVGSLLVPGSARAGDGSGGAKPGSAAPAPESTAQKDWSGHTGDIPFIVGREAGMREVEFSGKPVLFFYTATW